MSLFSSLSSFVKGASSKIKAANDMMESTVSFEDDHQQPIGASEHVSKKQCTEETRKEPSGGLKNNLTSFLSVVRKEKPPVPATVPMETEPSQSVPSTTHVQTNLNSFVIGADTRKDWHYLVKYGQRTTKIPESSGGVIVVPVAILDKNTGSRDVVVRAIRVRSIEALTSHYMHTDSFPTDPDIVENVIITGSLPSTSDAMIITLSSVTYKYGRNGECAILCVDSNNMCMMQPIPLTKRRCAWAFDCSIVELEDALRVQGMPNPESCFIVPCDIIAVWAQRLLYMIDPDFDMPQIDPEVNLRVRMVPAVWNYGETLAAIPERMTASTRLPMLFEDRLQKLVCLAKLDPNADVNSSYSRMKEEEQARWNSRTSVEVVDEYRMAIESEKMKEFAKKAGMSSVAISRMRSALIMRDTSFQQLQLTSDYMTYFLKCICNVFYTQNFRANSRLANDEERAVLLNIVERYMLPVATASQRLQAQKERDSVISIGRNARAAFLERRAAVEYLPLESLYLMARVILEEPWRLCVDVLMRRAIPMKPSMLFREMSLCELMRVITVLGLPDIEDNIKTAISLYQMQLRDALVGFRHKDVFVPMKQIMDNARQCNFVEQTSESLSLLVEWGAVVIDDDENITSLAFERQCDLALHPQKHITAQHRRENAEDRERVMIKHVYDQEQEIVKSFKSILLRNTKPFEIMSFDDYLKTINSTRETFMFRFDEHQLAWLDKISAQDDPSTTISVLSGRPGAGKSLLIATILSMMGKNKRFATVTTIANQAKNNIREIIAKKPFLITEAKDGVVCINACKLAVSYKEQDLRMRTRVLIFEEASMASTKSLHDLVTRMPNLQMLICIGDPNQLGAIEYGSPMTHIMRAGFYTHKLLNAYRAGPEALALNHNAELLANDPETAFVSDKYTSANCKNVAELEAAYKFDIETWLASNDNMARVQWDRQDFILNGKRSQSFKLMNIIDPVVANLALIKLSACVFIERDQTELLADNPKCVSVTPLLQVMKDHLGADEYNTRLISSMRYSCLMINAYAQLFYRQPDEEFKYTQRMALLEALRIRDSEESANTSGANVEVHLSSSQTSELASCRDPIPFNCNRSLTPLMKGDIIRIKQNNKLPDYLGKYLLPSEVLNRESPQPSFEINNGDIYEIAYIVDVMVTEVDRSIEAERRRDEMLRTMEEGQRAAFLKSEKTRMEKNKKKHGKKQNVYPPFFEEVSNRQVTEWYCATVPHSFAQFPVGYTFRRFLYFTNGDCLCYSDIYKDSISLAACGTVHSSQGSQSEFVVMVITQKDIATYFSNAQLMLVGKTRGKSKVFFLGTREEAHRISLRKQLTSFDVLEFRFVSMINRIFPIVRALREEKRYINWKEDIGKTVEKLASELKEEKLTPEYVSALVKRYCPSELYEEKMKEEILMLAMEQRRLEAIREAEIATLDIQLLLYLF